LRAFLSVEIEHQVPFFSFSFFFCNRFHTDGLNLSHAQMHIIVMLLLY